MFAQLILGAALMFMGICNASDTALFGKEIKERLGEAAPAYRRRIGLCFIALGLIIAVMGIIEHYDILSGGVFLLTYTVLIVVPLVLVLLTNKKYFGKFSPWL